MGTELYDSPHSVEVAGRAAAAIHDLSDVAERSVDAHAVVIHGCSHIRAVAHVGSTLLLNPGRGVRMDVRRANRRDARPGDADGGIPHARGGRVEGVARE